MPALIRWWARLIEWSAVGLIAVYIVWVLFFSESTHWIAFVLPLGCLIPLVQLRVLRPILKRARRADLRLCEHCGHPFEGDEPQQCQACQEAIHPEETRRLWRAAVLRFHRGGSHAKIPALKRWKIVVCMIAGIVSPVVCMMLGALYLVYSVQQNSNLPNGIGYLLALPAISLQLAFLGAAILLWFGVNQRVDRARENDFLVCPNCLFSLNGIVDSDVCPECGTEFQRDDLRRRWYENWARKKNFREAIELDIPLMIRDDAKA